MALYHSFKTFILINFMIILLINEIFSLCSFIADYVRDIRICILENIFTSSFSVNERFWLSFNYQRTQSKKSTLYLKKFKIFKKIFFPDYCLFYHLIQIFEYISNYSLLTSLIDTEIYDIQKNFTVMY
jgi:hypothetical protein